MARQIGPWLVEPRAAAVETHVRLLAEQLQALEERVRQLEAVLTREDETPEPG